eukprot:TRINITY_DN1714_c1_g1_i5.p1 TRINITY_DN1714_c1_g1~~TRINITY_DN1714_c1_g1_i5.p1  ORF type:complete len:242 (+),score=72.07 TRINITY_DN1714_c1_g1_i5:148-873(+)
MHAGGVGCRFLEHTASAVTEQDVVDYLQVQQAKCPANVVLEAASPLGALFLGGFQASTPSFAEKHAITHIVNTAKHLDRFFVGWAKRQLPVLHERGVSFHTGVQWVDDPKHPIFAEGDAEAEQVIGDACVYIHRARLEGGNVLVHCAQGKSRSTSLLVAYLFSLLTAPSVQSTLPEGVRAEMSQGSAAPQLDAAIRFVRTRRAIAEPNAGFHQQLLALLSSPALARIQQRVAELEEAAERA